MTTMSAPNSTAAAPELDDIPDPQVPAGGLDPGTPAPALSAQWREHEALLQGFCVRVESWLRDYHKAMTLCMEATLEPVRQCLTQAAAGNEHAQYQLSDALLKIQEHGIRVQTTPYTATVHATTPQGYVLDLTLQKASAPELVEALTSLMAWLEQAGFTGVQVGSDHDRRTR